MIEKIYDLPVMVDGNKTMVEFAIPIVASDDAEWKLKNVEIIKEDVEKKEGKTIKIPKEVELCFDIWNPETRKVKRKFFYGKIKDRIELEEEEKKEKRKPLFEPYVLKDNVSRQIILWERKKK